MSLPYEEAPGEAAFYGPKADFIVRDCIGRQWQLGTVQLDYVLPERFGLEYIGPDNQPHRPVMIHRAPLGSMERFMGILIEHFAGAFPLWLAPEQVRVLPISDKVAEYAQQVLARLLRARASAPRSTSGPRRSAPRSATRSSRRSRSCWSSAPRRPRPRRSPTATGQDGDQGAMPLDEAIARLKAEPESRRAADSRAPPPAPTDRGKGRRSHLLTDRQRSARGSMSHATLAKLRRSRSASTTSARRPSGSRPWVHRTPVMTSQDARRTGAAGRSSSSARTSRRSARSSSAVR